MDIDFEDSLMAPPTVSGSRAASSEPSVVSHRDPIEDADSTLTRKRPRLDSGEKARRSMSADFTSCDQRASDSKQLSHPTLPSAENHISPKIPSRVTINVRSQSISSTAANERVDQTALAQAVPSVTNGTSARDISTASERDMQKIQSRSSDRNDSLIASQIDSPSHPNDEFLSSNGTNTTPLESQELNIEAILSSFPLHADDSVAFVDSAKTMTTLLHTGSLDSGWLRSLSIWLDDHISQTAALRSFWSRIYLDEHDFWEEVSLGFLKLVQRTKVTFEDDIATIQDDLGRLLNAYTALAVRLTHVDVENLTSWTDDNAAKLHVLSSRCLRALVLILNVSHPSGIRSQLVRVHQNPCLPMSKTFLRLEAGAENGLKVMASLARELLAHIHVLPSLQTPFQGAIRVVYQLAATIQQDSSGSDTVEKSESLRTLAHGILRVFHEIEEELLVFIDGHILSLPTGDARREVLMTPACLLEQCADLDEFLAAELFQKVVFDPIQCSKDDVPELLANVWRMKLLKKCFMKSKMEMRVTAVTIMSGSLVELWTSHNSRADEVMQYLADVLLREEIANYIVGVDSHPNLISRSSNIIGFFIVNGRYGQAQTDLIWKTVANSPDPRVVSATLEMIRGMMSLMARADLLYLCRKLSQLSIDAFNHGMLVFWSDLFSHIFNPRHNQPDWIDLDDRMNVFDLCTHMMRITFPSKSQAANIATIHSEAGVQLRLATQAARFIDREAIYGKLLEEINGHTEQAGANAEIIFCMIRHSPTSSQDLDAVINLGLLRATIEDYACFVSRWSKVEKTTSPNTTMLAELGPRLDLISWLLSRRPQAAPTDLLTTLWDVAVGSAAIDDTARDKAWCKLADLARPQQARHAFLDLCLSKFIPEMGPDLYTSQSYCFIELAIRYHMGVEGGPTENEDGTIYIPGVELLWHVMLTVPPGSIEDLVVKLLAGAHQESTLSRLSPSSITKTHVAIVERCIKELTREWEQARTTVPAPETSSDNMDIDQQADKSPAESRFSRITCFLGMLLQNIRRSAKYILPTTKSGKEPGLSSDILIGTPLTVRFQAFNGHQGIIESLTVGNMETRRQLYNRLRDATGFVNFQTILGGQKIDLLELPNQTLDDWNRAEMGAFLVKEVKTAPMNTNDSVLHVGRCEAELELLNHFDKLYQFMEQDDVFSRLTYDFLATFPAYEGAKLEGLVDGQALLEDVFPSGRLYQIRYSIRCLQTRLESQVRTRSIDECFVQGALRLLSNFATQAENLEEHSHSSLIVEIASEIVQCLHSILTESPVQAKELVQPAALVDRLVSILHRSKHEHAFYKMAGNTYATILELASHSEQAWQRFQQQEDLEALHFALFLEDSPRVFPGPGSFGNGASLLRNNVAVVIKAKLKSGLRWIAVSPAEVAEFYWALLQPMIPRSLQHMDKSQKLLQTAQTALETLIGGYLDDELNSSETQAMLRATFDKYTTLLAEHRHTEFVGRNEPDIVIKGLTRLAECCYFALNDAAAGISTEEFNSTISNRFLFPPLFSDGDEYQAAPLMPVLDPLTRKALYDLLLTLCQEPSTLKQLLQIALDALRTDDFSRTMYHREYFLRAPSGLIGIRNLGNTCYMNALLTQLYMNLDYRKFMLDLRVADPKSQGIVLAIQALFAQMQEGYQKYVDASDLTRLITTFEGEAIDVTQQMDVEEFFNLKFDQTEAQIPIEEDKKAFRSIYGGQMINQIKSKECEHVSERLEPYFAVQCDVKGKTNLLESLQAFVQGDVMEGDNKYKCESCGGRFVNAVKRTCLKDVPDHLIFHLKRFDFDIGTMQRSKINDLFEFPMCIDVSPYTFTHLNAPEEPIDEDPFDLVGVLLHKGVAEHGHYFSYIRSRPSVAGEGPRWFCFDDADVTEFSPSEIKEKCYGGMIDPKELSFMDGPPLLKGYNAYMLFYQRAGTIENQQALSSLEASPPKVAVPPELVEGIGQRNEITLREYTLFDSTHLGFLKDLLKRLPSMQRRMCTQSHALEDYAIRTALMYLHQVFSRNKDVQEFQIFLELIQDMISGCHLCHLTTIKVIFPEPTMLESEHSIISDMLIRSTVGKIRLLFQDFVAGVISYLKVDVYVSEEEYGVAKDDGAFDHAFPFHGDSSVILRVVQVMYYHMDHLGANTRSWDHFFGLLCSIAGLGLGEVAALLEHKIFTRCLDLIVLTYDISYEPSRNWRILARLMEKRSIPHNKLIELIDMILDHIDLREPHSFEYEDRLSEFDEESQAFPLTKDEYYLLIRKHPDREIPYFIYRLLEVWDYTRLGRDHASSIFAKIQNSEIIRPMFLYNALQGGIEANADPQPYLSAAARFCTRTNERMIEKTVNVAVQCTLSADTSGLGIPLTNFFQAVAFKEARGCPQEPLAGFEIVVREMSNWANPLIFNSDSEVRDTATRLIGNLLNKVLPDTPAGSIIEQQRLRSVRLVASHTSRQLQRHYEEGTAGKKHVRTAIMAMRACVAYLSNLPEDLKDGNDDILIERAAEHQLRFQQWPWQDDPEHSDDWQSDTILSDDDVIEVP